MSLRDKLGLTALTFFGSCLFLCLPAACAQQPSPDPTPIPESHPLQGYWEGDDGSEEVTVTIEGNSLYFYRRADFQYDTSFELVPGTDPAELRATILDTPRTTDSAGDVVIAIYEFENGTLHLAAINKVEGEPASFDENLGKYRLERVQAGE